CGKIRPTPARERQFRDRPKPPHGEGPLRASADRQRSLGLAPIRRKLSVVFGSHPFATLELDTTTCDLMCALTRLNKLVSCSVGHTLRLTGSSLCRLLGAPGSTQRQEERGTMFFKRSQPDATQPDNAKASASVSKSLAISDGPSEPLPVA